MISGFDTRTLSILNDDLTDFIKDYATLINDGTTYTTYTKIGGLCIV